MKLLQAMLSPTPEALNPVDMRRAWRKLACAVVHSIVFRGADINESIRAAPAITMDDRLRSKATANNGLKGGLRAVRHALRRDFAVTLQQSEDRSLATSPATALATNATSTEVAFINFDFAGKWRCADEF